MKKLTALLLVLAMVCCLAACGGDKKESKPKEPTLEEKYDIDLNATGEQEMSDERAAKSVLIETKDVWLGGQMTFALASDQKTYEDFVEHIGCDASYYVNMPEDGERHFVWIAEDDETAKLLAVFWETPKGWTLYSVGTTNLS